MASREELLQYTPEEINRMTKEQLYQLAKQEQKNIKDSLYRLKKEGLSTPARKQLEKTGNISARKNMTAGQLKHEVMKGQVILRYKTGTVTGAKQVEQSMKEGFLGRLQSRLDVKNITEEESKTMWDVIKRLGESPETKTLLDTTDMKYIPKETQQRVYEIMKVAESEGDPDKLYSYTEGLLKNVYEGSTFESEIDKLKQSLQEGKETEFYGVD